MNGDMAIVREWAEAKVGRRRFATDYDLEVARHILATTTTPERPEVLTTKDDYENAPVGTIVAGDYADPWVKDYLGLWLGFGADEGEASPVMAFVARRVLRWGETL